MAIAEEGTGIRVLAAPADLDLGHGAGEHLAELAEQTGDGLDERLHLGCKVLEGEELAQIVGAPRIHIVAVEMQKAHAADRQTGPAKDVCLDAKVGDVLRLDLSGRLDLDERPVAAVLFEERIGADEHPVVAEGALVEAGGAVAQQARRGLNGLVALGVVLLHQYTAREDLTSQFADRVPLVEDGLFALRNGIGQSGRPAQQPQILGALQPGLEPGLGESRSPRSHFTPHQLDCIELMSKEARIGDTPKANVCVRQIC